MLAIFIVALKSLKSYSLANSNENVREIMSSDLSLRQTLLSDIWGTVKSVVSAGVAIVVTYEGFVRKSALQVGEVPSYRAPKTILKGSLKAASLVGPTVGCQIGIQSVVEHVLFLKDQKKELTSGQRLISSSIVGFVSAPLLAAFNGMTMHDSFMSSLRNVSLKQAGAIVGRDISFLFSVSISGPLTKASQEMFGQNALVAGCTAFTTGALGGYAGHPCDTILSRLQKGMKIELLQMGRGIHVRAGTLGVFNVVYTFCNKAMS